ncbi:glutathione S-transferase family protein [Vulgatibacter sp.]|uniref:glutathione S-transferase family protein n=1 Tax=Vulgatibacter sp. TaxID=1971226 RepID=UPI003568ED2F
MGRLIDGVWTTQGYRSDEKGRFERDQTTFRDRITADGSSGLPAVAGRYHLYVSLACPWAHRTLILRKLKGLEEAISVSVVDPYMGEDGWFFSDHPGATRDEVNGAEKLWQLYVKAKPGITTRVTVPILWDKERGTIVNNESREIVRMLDTGFDAVAKSPVTLCPAELLPRIEETIDGLYESVNDGVYRAGFAMTQPAYDEAVTGLFAALDRYEGILSGQRFLCGNLLTEPDVFLFTTLVRFDPVYYVHFKCNVRRIEEYPALSGFLRDVYQTDGVRETVNLRHIKEHYYRSHPFLNPRGVVPKGPAIDLDRPHDRDRFGGGLATR